VLASSPGAISGLATDGANVYFISGDALYEAAATGGEARVVATVPSAALANLKYVAGAPRTILIFDDGRRIFEVSLP
jgi:hypothetical protein